MSSHPIEAILITDRNGTPRFYMQLDPLAFGMDPVLASSFFAAIDMFSKEVFEQSTKIFQIDYGPRVFTVVHGVSTSLVAICAQRLSREILKTLDSLLAEFELEWLAVAKSFNFEESFVDVYLEAFGETVMKRLSLQELPDSWVPYFTIKPDDAPMAYSMILPYINGTRNMREIQAMSGVSKENMLLEMSRLWAHRVIRFRNILSFQDFLSARTQFLRYIQATSNETRDLSNMHPDMVGVIPRLAGLMDGRRTVGEILVELRGQVDERELLRVMEYLRETEVIEVLSPEKRRILLVKEVLEIALRVAETTYGALETTTVFESVMNTSETPETLSQLHLKDSKWTVNFDFKMLEGLSNKRLMLLYGEWMKILAQFASSLKQEGINVFIDDLTKGFSERIINRYTAYDLRGFEEFSFWLELLSTKELPHVDIIQTSNLNPSDPTVLEELVSVLVTRGQAIYSPRRISEICTISGISLVDSIQIENEQHHSVEAINRFIIEYSKFGSGAKLTLLTLSRQRGISLPSEIEV